MFRWSDGVDPKDVAIVVDTAPGEVAQVDFGTATSSKSSATRTGTPPGGRDRNAA